MASFTQKHYKTVAHVLKTNLANHEIDFTYSGADAVKGIALDLHNVFRMDNPRYDANKFMDACGIDDWKDITEPTEHDIQPYETPDFYGEQV